MTCGSCGSRKARRACPGLGRDICAVCCGTKRGVQINCPPDCVYLRSARAHPPAVQRRQQERDLAVLIPAMRDLREDQTPLFWLTITFLGGYQADGLIRLTDDDVADATAALASTFETSARGVIYEHRATSLAGQRLAGDLRQFFEELGRGERRLTDATMASVLRAIEHGARAARKTLDGGDRAYLQLAARLKRATAADGEAGTKGAPEAGHTGTSSLLIVP